MNRVVHKLLGAIAASTLAACAVGPNYQRPATPVDAHFANASQPGFAEDVAVEQPGSGAASRVPVRLTLTGLNAAYDFTTELQIPARPAPPPVASPSEHTTQAAPSLGTK